jgi:hypothetical protein
MHGLAWARKWRYIGICAIPDPLPTPENQPKKRKSFSDRPQEASVKLRKIWAFLRGATEA